MGHQRGDIRSEPGDILPPSVLPEGFLTHVVEDLLGLRLDLPLEVGQWLGILPVARAEEEAVGGRQYAWLGVALEDILGEGNLTKAIDCLSPFLDLCIRLLSSLQDITAIGR